MFGIIILGIVLVSIIAVSAAWTDMFKFGSENKNLSGELPSTAVASVKIQDNAAPNITFVSDAIANSPGSSAGNVKLISRTTPDTTDVNFTFIAQQGGNQYGNLYPIATTSATGYFYKSGETNRNTVICNPLAIVNWNGFTNNAVNYSCQVKMKYYDGPGVWTINISVTDNNAQKGYNTTKTFAVLSTQAASTSNGYLNWTNPALTVATATNRPSDNNLSISNDGNVPYTQTRVNATNLSGVDNPVLKIPSDKFKVNTCTGNVLPANTYITPTFSIPDATTDLGSSQPLSFCISDLLGLGLTNQIYQSDRAWIIDFPNS